MDRIKDLRIYEHHNLAFDRGEQITINFEGKKIKAFTREPVAVALFASGIPVTMRSFKYHRPRGMFCVNGKCSSCLMRIDGIPNQRACRIRCKDGMFVQRQASVPNASDDLLFTNDFLFPNFLDYHHLFTKPQWLNKALGKVVRTFSGLGAIPDHPATEAPVIRDIECDVAVIGAGPAGIAASLAAASAKASVILVDDHRRPGGHLLSYPELIDDQFTGMSYCFERMALLIENGVRFFAENEVTGYYEEGFFCCIKEGQLIRLHPKRTVVATGGYDQNFIFAQSDLPNIFSVRGLSKLAMQWGICPGVRIFILGSNDEALSLALRLDEIGVRIVGIAEQGDRIEGNLAWGEEIQTRGIPVFLNYRPTRAIGRFHLKGIELKPTSSGDNIRTHCDLIAVGAPPAPAYELASQAGVKVRFDLPAGGFVPEHDSFGRTNVETIFVAGEITGGMNSNSARVQGRIAGYKAALDLYPSQKVQSKLDQIIQTGRL